VHLHKESDSPSLGDIACDRLTTATVRRWIVHMRGPNGPGVSTAAKCYRLLRSIMATAVEDGPALTNPCTIKGAGTEPKPETEIPSVAEVHKLADCIDERLRCVVLLAAFVGLRKGELLGLRRGDIDLDANMLTINQQRQALQSGKQLVGPPKTDAGKRSVAIPSALIDEVAHHLDHYAQSGDDGYVFTGVKGGRLSQAVLTKQWTAARKNVGVEHIRLHDLRRLAGTLAASTGAGTKELMHRFGHASPRAALIYQHATRERDIAIAEAMNEHINHTSRRSG
jgi:integrase